MHSFVYDADENRDYLKGLALQFHMQAGGELWNRHVGFSGDTGMFYEAVQPAYTQKGVHPIYEKQQVDGQFVIIDPVTEAGWDWPGIAARMMAYAGCRYRNPERMQQAIDLLKGDGAVGVSTPGKTDEAGNVAYLHVEETEYIRKIQEVPYLSTNGVSQWSLNLMEIAKLREMMKHNSRTGASMV